MLEEGGVDEGEDGGREEAFRAPRGAEGQDLQVALIAGDQDLLKMAGRDVRRSEAANEGQDEMGQRKGNGVSLTVLLRPSLQLSQIE